MASKCCLWNKWYWPHLQNRQHRRRESIWSYCLSIYQRRLVWHSLGYLDELITPPRLQWTKPQNPMGKIEKPNWAIIHESHHTIALGVQHVICCQLQSKEFFHSSFPANYFLVIWLSFCLDVFMTTILHKKRNVLCECFSSKALWYFHRQTTSYSYISLASELVCSA